MLFSEFDHGAIVRKETGRDTPRMIRFVIGNPLIMKEMVKHVPDAGSYAPVTVLVDERTDGVHLSYDRMGSLLAPYENPDALEVARNPGYKSRRSFATSCSLKSNGRKGMENIGKTSTTKTGSNVTARTQFLETNTERY